METEAELDAESASKPVGSWFGSAVGSLAVGALGPANVYFYFTDPNYLDGESWWRTLLLPFGVWLLTGLLLRGLAIVWVGGIRRRSSWEKAADDTWAWWSKAGLWLIGIAIALVLMLMLFGGATQFLSGVSRGTLLIAGLLFMILLALWRISDQMRQR